MSMRVCGQDVLGSLGLILTNLRGSQSVLCEHLLWYLHWSPSYITIADARLVPALALRRALALAPKTPKGRSNVQMKCQGMAGIGTVDVKGWH